jgi:hypothetical protein
MKNAGLKSVRGANSSPAPGAAEGSVAAPCMMLEISP